jgi:hypothetical protein
LQLFQSYLENPGGDEEKNDLPTHTAIVEKQNSFMFKPDACSFVCIGEYNIYKRRQFKIG